MLIYEKDNKLNINFENNVEEQPDLQIGKSGDKTEVLIDGQPGSGGSSGGGLKLLLTRVETGVPQAVVDAAQAYYPDAAYGYHYFSCNKTASEIQGAFDNGSAIWIDEDGALCIVLAYNYLDDVGLYYMTINNKDIPLVFVGDAAWSFEEKRR